MASQFRHRAWTHFNESAGLGFGYECLWNNKNGVRESEFDLLEKQNGVSSVKKSKISVIQKAFLFETKLLDRLYQIDTGTLIQMTDLLSRRSEHNTVMKWLNRIKTKSAYHPRLRGITVTCDPRNML